MTTESLFNQDQEVAEPADFLAELVGEGKKFKSPEDLAKSKWHSDVHIKTVEQENNELRSAYIKLREDYNARAKLEELIDQMNNVRSQQPPNQEPPMMEDKKPAFDPSQLKPLVSEEIRQYELQKRAQENLDTVKAKLKEQYGDNFATVLRQKTNELRLDDNYVNELAKRSPAALFRMLDLDAKQDTFQAPPKSSQRGDSFRPKGQEKRTWTYYQNLKKTNPKLYLDPQINLQMQQDYERLGTEFEDGDFPRSR